MKKLDSRRMTRLFLENMSVRPWNNEACTSCFTVPCSCDNSIDINVDPESDYSLDSMTGGSDHDIDPDNDGLISRDDLFNHFDLDNDGTVTTDEYVDHIQYHTDNPSTLDHYREDVPCNNSYSSCYSHHDNDREILRNCISQTGATCMQSGIQALIDVLQSMKQNGII